MEESEFSSGETQVKVLRLGGVHQTKKDPRGAHTSEIPSSRSDAPSPSSWSLVMRSGRTVRRGSGDRSWFGRPQEIKKAAGNAARKRGRTRRRWWTRQRNHPLQAIVGAVGVVYELQKKRRVPNPSPYDASSPHQRERVKDDGRNTYWSSPSRQKVPGVRQPRKSRGPTLCPCSTHSPPYRGMT